MPRNRVEFQLRFEDVERINQAIANAGHTAEKSINVYLHGIGAYVIADEITKFMPRSVVDKIHAKDSEWWEIQPFNLAVEISNSLKGKRGTSFYYLYYPSTGTGTSKRKGRNLFMEQGLKSKQDTIVNGMIEAILKNIDNAMEIRDSNLKNRTYSTEKSKKNKKRS